MKQSTRMVSGARITSLLACLLVATSGQAQVLLSDDFNDNSFDTSKWFTQLPFGGSVLEQNQRMEFTNRGYLVTQSQFEPIGVGGLRITGRWTFNNASFPGHDILQVVTRTSGTPGGIGAAEISSGISFMINGNDAIRINDMTNNISLVSEAPLTVDNGDVFDFEIRDDGFNLFFDVREVGGQGAMATLMTTCNLLSPSNRVAFYNRETNNGGFTTLAYLDNVVIQTVPEPSSLILLGVGIMCWRFRQRNRS